MKGSPAEKAGFLPGDMLIAVNNNFSKNVQEYKTMMQNVGEKLKIVVKAGRRPVQLTLKVKSILVNPAPYSPASHYFCRLHGG